MKVRAAIVHAHREDGLTYAEVAELLGIGVATVNRVLRRFRETGSVAPKPRGGGNWSPIQGKVAKLLESIVTEMPDATVAELTDALVTRGGIATSRSSVQRALERAGFSRKKSPSSPKSATPRRTVGGAVSSAPSSRR